MVNRGPHPPEEFVMRFLADAHHVVPMASPEGPHLRHGVNPCSGARAAEEPQQVIGLTLQHGAEAHVHPVVTGCQDFLYLAGQEVPLARSRPPSGHDSPGRLLSNEPRTEAVQRAQRRGRQVHRVARHQVQSSTIPPSVDAPEVRFDTAE